MALRNARMGISKIKKAHELWPQLFTQKSFNKYLLCEGTEHNTKIK